MHVCERLEICMHKEDQKVVKSNSLIYIYTFFNVEVSFPFLIVILNLTQVLEELMGKARK